MCIRDSVLTDGKEQADIDEAVDDDFIGGGLLVVFDYRKILLEDAFGMKLVFGIKVLFDGQTVLLAQGYARKLHGLFEKMQLFAGQPFKQIQSCLLYTSRCV